MSAATTPIPGVGMLQSLQRLGLLGESDQPTFEALAGGVSSDIWKVDNEEQVFCVKQALSKLKVDADWFAPVERNRYEVAWYRIADSIIPGAAPRVIAHDEAAVLFAMEYVEPEQNPLWKNELRDGRADTVQAARVGRSLGRIHASTAGRAEIKSQFPPNEIFQEIRLEPYLEATAERHPDLREALFALSRRSRDTRLAMVHGDVSPKNILLGSRTPVFLDAECACYGDPAFDLAFCLNHFLLKCLWTPAAVAGFLACYREMASAYLEEVDWEASDQLEYRAATLLPALFLARVDGKSPVEYIDDESGRDRVRRCARSLITQSPRLLEQVAASWQEELAT